MKVCIPSMGNKGLKEQVGERFWKVPTFTLLDTGTNEVSIIENTIKYLDGPGNTFEIIDKSKVNTMLCSSLNIKAARKFEKLGIMVYVGASGTVKNAIDMWKKNKLKKATDEIACQLHAFRRYYNRQPL